jgi:hypothetical protein
MRRRGEPPVCSGINYGSYVGTKAVFNDGVNNYLRNASFNYDNSATGFTILSMWFNNSANWVDFNFLLNIKNSISEEVSRIVGATDIGARSPAAAISVKTPISDIQQPIYIATTYTPDGMGGSFAASYVNGIQLYNQSYASSVWSNWNGGTLEYFMFRRNGGSNNALGFCGFIQIIDQGISPLCAEAWTVNRSPRNIVGSFNDVLLMDFNSGVQNIGGNDVIADLGPNSWHVILQGFSAAQKDPMNAAYCIVNIP